MIRLIGLNNKDLILNEELIEKIEAIPESIITLNNGKKYIVLETVDEILKKIVDYKRKTRVPFVEE